MPSGKSLPDEQQKRIVELYQAGKSRLEIQIDTRVSQPTIRKVLTKAGFPPKEMREPVTITDEIKNEVIRLRNLGLSAGKIAETTGVSKRWVIGIYKENIDGINGRGDRVSPEEFVAAWQTSVSLTEVCEKTGLSFTNAASRAFIYRQRGVQLKRLKSRHSNDWDGLAEFASLFEDDNGA